MLRREDFVYFGKFLKPHGTKGEITLEGESIVLGEDCDFVACDINGILVPFFFEERRQRNSGSMIVKIERLDSAEQVRLLTNRDAYIPREWTEDNEVLSLDIFKGFTAIDVNLGVIGEVCDIDDSTINTLFVIDNDGEEILVPAQEEFIAGIDQKKKEILFDLPEGLVSL